MKLKLIFLYILLAIFVCFGCFSAWQYFSSSAPEDEIPEEEPYVFTELQELVEVPAAEDEEKNVEYDAKTLHSMNNDFVGWLAIPDTTISFPIVQGPDNEFYLRRGFNKAYSSFGCPFLDVRTPVSGDNMVIHGHNIGNNRTEVFSPLLLFQSPVYASTHKTAFFSVYGIDSKTQYELFAVVNFDLNNEISYFVSEFEDPESREEYIRFLKEHSLYNSEFAPEGDILILSTCNRTYGEDNRLLICLGEI